MPTLAILDDKRLKLIVGASDTLAEPVGTTRWLPQVQPNLKRDFPLDIFGQQAELGVRASAGVLVHDAGHEAEVFGTGERHAAPPGQSLVELHLLAGFGIAADGSLLSRPLATIEVSAGVGGEIAYHHLLPVAQDRTRLRALRGVTKRAQPLPGRLELARLVPGEAHVYCASLNVDLGLRARFGHTVDIDRVVGLFDGLEVPVKTHVELTLQAGLGWSLYREMRLAVAASEATPGWIRARIERTRRRRFSVGASVDLKVDYDLAAPLEAMLDYALELDATADVFEALEKVASFSSDGRWNDLEARLESRLADRIAELVEDSDWRGWLKSSTKAKRLTDLAARLVASYKGLDAEVASRVRALWTDVLDVTRLQSGSKARRALEAIKSLDPDDLDIDALLGMDGGRVVELLETLTGQSFQELLVDTRLKGSLGAAREAAERILELADGVPGELVEKFSRLEAKSRVGDVVAFLEKNATSKAALEAAIDRAIRPRIKSLAERLIGTAWDRLVDDDIARLKAWAGRAQRFLADKDEWEKKARAAILELRGAVGYSLNLEFERVTESTAILDLEANPKRDGVRRAVQRGLRSGDAATLLAELPDDDTDDGDADDVDWFVREGLFTSRRVRTGTLTMLSTLAGKARKQSERIQESEVRIAGRRRTARYGAGFTRRVAVSTDPRRSEASVWWLASCAGSGVDPTSPYDRVSDELRLSFQRHDGKTMPGEIAGLDVLMTDLGFGAGDSRPIDTAVRARMAEEAGDAPEDFPIGVPLPALETSLEMELRLPQAAVDRLLLVGDDDEWSRDFLNAAHRWYREPSIHDALEHRPDVRKGSVLAAIVTSPEFRARWRAGYPRFAAAFENKAWEVPTDSGSARVVLVKGNGAPRFASEYGSLGWLIYKRGRSRKRIDEAEAAHRPAVAGALPADLERAAKRISRGFKVAAVVQDWPNPGFLPWLCLARASRDAAILAGATGAATFRWRRDPSSEFRVHAWRLDGGVPDLQRPGVFPIRD